MIISVKFLNVVFFPPLLRQGGFFMNKQLWYLGFDARYASSSVLFCDSVVISDLTPALLGRIA